MQSTLRPRLVAAALASLAAPACAAAGIAVFSDDFATPQTLAEHWRDGRPSPTRVTAGMLAAMA